MPASRWVMIWLCFAINALGYIDRANLAVAVPFIRHDLHIGDAAMGLVLGSFYWTYAALQLPAGYLMDRLRLRGGVAGAVLLWSGATAATAASGGPMSLFAFRLLLGAGEGPVYPAATKLIAAWFAPRDRGIAAAILNTGPRVGTAIAVPMIAAIIAWGGWRVSFIITGALGVLLAAVWFTLYRQGPLEVASAAPAAAMPSLRAVIRTVLPQRRFIGAVCGHFCYLFAVYFFITWFPTYLMRTRGFSLAELGYVGGLPTIVAIPATMLGGVVCDRLMRRGWGVTPARKICLVGGMLVGASMMAIPLINGTAAIITVFCISSAGLGFASGVTFAALAEIAPSPQLIGTVTALANGLGNLAGVVTAAFTGFMLTITGGSFDAVLVSFGAVSLLSAAFFGLVLDEVAPMRGVAFAPVPVARKRFLF